ncbi:hypothetical protein BAUCODRAFT_127325 [Baudoinia panamericana UAMH 10762]|uniref:Uncharacterized protein n=1 Tax=Baudoinia panamericana (strain UAMH 10762) TaxID=717646 RepID=M2MYP5_BAUPA|nr:uncharacterized protein BAUCODRAFT_127325 [Baudoinia panamericana UAMH 10762]EMC91425.1 hypothetical protein BAUCODRAFT_127325 [Baudoinia panamericana UAMH 10762]
MAKGATKKARDAIAKVLGPEPSLSIEQIAQLDRLVAEHYTEIHGLRAANAAIASRERAAKKAVELRKDEVKHLNKKVQDRTQEVANVKAEMNKLERVHAALEKGLCDRDDRIARMIKESSKARREHTEDAGYGKRFAQHAPADNRKLLEQHKTINDQQRRITELEEANEESDLALHLAEATWAKAHVERDASKAMCVSPCLSIMVEVQCCADADNYRLVDREAHIIRLTEQIRGLTSIAGASNAAVGAALEAQAQQDLTLVKRLQADLAARDATIDDLQGSKADSIRNLQDKHEALLQNYGAVKQDFEQFCRESKRDFNVYMSSAEEQLRNLEERQEALMKKHSQVKQDLELKLRGAEERVIDAKTRGDSALAEKTSELKVILDDQQKLIEKLLAANRA